tara:strand:+ start:251 stop:541 length:291 start_codon:yes stop_codon:yes gene_type:complete
MSRSVIHKSIKCLSSLDGLIEMRDHVSSKVAKWDPADYSYDLLDFRMDCKILSFLNHMIREKKKKIDQDHERIINIPDGLVDDADPQDLAATKGGR